MSEDAVSDRSRSDAPVLSARDELQGGPTARLKKRADFLRAAKGRKAHVSLFTIQVVDRASDQAARVGFTVTKKVGGAVERNRIKRRLREVVRTAPDLGIEPSHDYVIVARRTVLAASSRGLVAGLKSAIRKLHGSTPKARSGFKAGAMSDLSERDE